MSCARQCVRTLPMFRPQEELEFLTLVRTAASAYFFIERERGGRERESPESLHCILEVHSCCKCKHSLSQIV